MIRFADRKSIWRLLIILAAVVALGAGTGLYMCKCICRGKRIMQPVSISAEKLKSHVETLAGTIGERNVFRTNQLRAAQAYIEAGWRSQGYEITRHAYKAHDVECVNIEVMRRGTDKPNEIILLGAHYDSVAGSPGANDNGSAVASLLELSRVFAKEGPKCTVRFVAFVNEEPPFFETGEMGSEVYAKMARARGDDIRAMISLETMGYFSDVPGSQKYPPLFSLFYPNRGNFIAFVSDLKSRSLLHKSVGAFRAHSDFPIECCSTFGRIPGVDWSDHASFWRAGYRAFMVTDTAPFRYPHYHTAEDTPDKVNYEKLAHVTEGLCGVVATLAGE
jgi:hypothetical protein